MRAGEPRQLCVPRERLLAACSTLCVDEIEGATLKARDV
jgi:hypothetical protein